MMTPFNDMINDMITDFKPSWFQSKAACAFCKATKSAVTHVRVNLCSNLDPEP